MAFTYGNRLTIFIDTHAKQIYKFAVFNKKKIKNIFIKLIKDLVEYI